MANEKSCTARELVDEFIAAKQKEAASQFDLDDLRSRLATFSGRFNGHRVDTITSSQIDDWLRSLNVSIVTRNHYRRLIMLAFNLPCNADTLILIQSLAGSLSAALAAVNRSGWLGHGASNVDAAIAQLSDGLMDVNGII